MSFSLPKQLLILVCSLALTSCAYFVGDERKQEKTIEIKSDSQQGACLVESMGALPRFLSSRVGSDQKNEVIDCADESLGKFIASTSGEKREAYSETELVKFVEKYFPDAKGVDKNFIATIIRIKHSLYGGSAQEISKDEFEKLRGLLRLIKDVTARLAPHVEIYSWQAKINPLVPTDVQRVEQATQDFVTQMQRILDFIGQSGKSDLKFSDLLTLLYRFEGFQERYERFIPTLLTFKALFVRPPEDVIRGDEWAPVLKALVKSYSMGVRAHYLLKGQALATPESFRQYEFVLSELLSLLEVSLNLHEGKQISFNEWDRALVRLNEMGALPGSAKVEIWQKTLRAIFAKGLRDENTSPQDAPVEFAAIQMKNLRERINDYFSHHKVLMSVFGNAEKVRLRHLLETLSEQSTPAEFQIRRGLIDLLKTGRVLRWTSDNQVIIEPSDEMTQLSRRDLIAFNTIRAGVRAVIKGYAEDKSRAARATGITDEEFQRFYSDVRDFGISFGLMDPRVRTAGYRSFMEANLFTSVSNGDHLASLREGIEFFAVGSAGGMMGEVLYKEWLQFPNCTSDRKDPFDVPMLKIECFRDRMKTALAERFAHLPEFSSYFSKELKNDANKLKEFVRTFEMASRPMGVSTSPIEAAEVKSMFPMLYYTESLMLNFDSNRDAILQSEEIDRAFPVFKNFIRRLGKGAAETEEIQKSIFSYLIRFGEPPETTITGKGLLAGWHLGRGMVDFFSSTTAARPDLLKVMAGTSTMARRDRVNRMSDFMVNFRPDLQEAFASGDSAVIGKLLELVQCGPEVIEEFKGLLKEIGEELLLPLPPLRKNGPPVAVPVETFIQRLSQAIRTNKALALSCVPQR